MRYTWFSGKGPRMNNEDCCNIVEVDKDRVLFVVCDGMGGHSHGEIASQTICDAYSSFWKENPDVMDSQEKVMKAARVASMKLDEESGDRQMGTTLVLCSIEGRQATIAHAGDSRCYVIDIKGRVKHCTTDHVESNPFSQQSINKAFFTRHPEKAAPDVKVIELQPLDRILLCTDGLYNAINDETLLHTLQCSKDVEQVAEKYRAICMEKANDNYTAIIIEME